MVTVYTSSTTVTAPSDGTYVVEAIGGGGNGGGAGGAGGGAYASKSVAVTAGQQLAITVGAGAASTVAIGGTTHVSAAPGSASTGDTGAPGGAAANSVGTTRYSGGNGGNGGSGTYLDPFTNKPVPYSYRGGGGGGAGSGGAGSNGSNGTQDGEFSIDGTGGAGNTSGTWDGGNGGGGGASGNSPGGGGGGAGNASSGRVRLDFTASSGGGGGGTAPTITSSASVSTPEETTSLAHDLEPSGSDYTWSLTGGADESKFRVTGATGSLAKLRWVLGFTPDYENPADSGGNNVYQARVRCTQDSTGLYSEQFINVTVTNATEGGASPPVISPTQTSWTVEGGAGWSQQFTANEAVTWSETSPDFTVGSSTGVLSLMTTPSFTVGTYTATLTATSTASGLSTTHNVSVEVVASGGGGGGGGAATLGPLAVTGLVGESSYDNEYQKLNDLNDNTITTKNRLNAGQSTGPADISFDLSSIPDGETVTGLEVTFVGFSDSGSTFSTSGQILQGASVVGNQRVVLVCPDQTPTTQTTGAAGDTWGLTSAQLLGSAFKQSKLRIISTRTDGGGGGRKHYLDYVTLTVYYGSDSVDIIWCTSL